MSATDAAPTHAIPLPERLALGDGHVLVRGDDPRRWRLDLRDRRCSGDLEALVGVLHPDPGPGRDARIREIRALVGEALPWRRAAATAPVIRDALDRAGEGTASRLAVVPIAGEDDVQATRRRYLRAHLLDQIVANHNEVIRTPYGTCPRMLVGPGEAYAWIDDGACVVREIDDGTRLGSDADRIILRAELCPAESGPPGIREAFGAYLSQLVNIPRGGDLVASRRHMESLHGRLDMLKDIRTRR